MEILKVPGNLDSLQIIAEFLKELSNQAGLEKKTLYKLRLAVDEIVTNIIIHGYEEAGLSGDIEIKAQIDEKSLTIVVEDTGYEFDPTKQKPPENLNSPLEERKVGGLGVFLAIHAVDEFVYERIEDRNSNKFVVYKANKEYL